MIQTHPLHTRRLHLRRFETCDHALLRDLLRDARVRRYLGGPIPTEAIPSTLERYDNLGIRGGLWTCMRMEQPVGLVSLTTHKDGEDVELSYQFDPAIWREGFALEAVRAVIAHAAKTTILPLIIAETQAANVASVRLLERLGMHEVRRLERFGAAQIIFSIDLRGK